MNKSLNKPSKGLPAKSPTSQVRIIGGQWKRSSLPVVAIEGLRPTPDRVRETLCNWVAHQCGQDWGSLRVLDLFAGTGALGFEAASRGAAQVVLNELHPQAARHLRASIEKLKATNIQVMQQDALMTLRQTTQPYQLVLLDPPFAQGWLPKIWPWLSRAVAPQSWVYVECEAPLQQILGEPMVELSADDTLPGGWKILRYDKAGQVHYHLLQFSPSE